MKRDIKILFEINKSALGGVSGDFSGEARDVAFIDGLFEIYLEERLFFSDPYFPLLEFVVALSPWLFTSNTDVKATFRFETMHCSEGPILEIIKEGKGWRLASIWQKFESRNIIEEDILFNAFSRFIKELNSELLPVSGFYIEHYL